MHNSTQSWLERLTTVNRVSSLQGREKKGGDSAEMLRPLQYRPHFQGDPARC